MATAQNTIRMPALAGQARHRNAQSQSKLAQFSQRDRYLEAESQSVVHSWSSEMRDGAPQARAMTDNTPRIHFSGHRRDRQSLCLRWWKNPVEGMPMQ